MNERCDEIERAAHYVEAENARTIAEARAALATSGTAECIECGREIEPKRRAAMPAARRCIECQSLIEAEKYHK
ncbi:TraR/DksA C4-type zinc finger protein [Rhizobium sp. C1]|uniref:TraR/DksA C4-type zinc finger protein n=1 Tax=Rhizobium sp. C1 TaxID=1349799 RepID=UPI001E4BB4E4|nr:TraR/DksA C4-type zinc finger protein [Rhizobium sp. C1]MCD2176459.1 TraR/DksA C4-type zinc finger protein [Rhizobium sp. C1]